MDYNNQINVLKHYNCKNGTYPLVADALKQHTSVTLELKYFKETKFLGTMEKEPYFKTPFKEVWIKKPDYKPYLPVNDGLKKLIKLIKNSWFNNVFHIILHSSGWDSRLISSILKDLQNKYGINRFDNLLFLCIGPEGKWFKEIMERQGWEKNQYFTYNEHINEDFRAELVDFHNIWKWVNHPYGIPTSPFGPAIEDAKKRGLVPINKPIHILSGFLANESMERARKDFVLTYGIQHILAPMWSAIQHQGLFMPFINKNIPHIDREKELKNNYPEIHKIHYLKQAFKIGNYWAGFDKRLSKATKKDIKTFYNESWLVTHGNFPIKDMIPHVGVDPWWRNYVLASLCDELINNNIKIKIK